MVVRTLGVFPDESPVEGVQLGIHLAHQGHVAQKSRVLRPDDVGLYPAYIIERIGNVFRWRGQRLDVKSGNFARTYRTAP